MKPLFLGLSKYDPSLVKKSDVKHFQTLEFNAPDCFQWKKFKPAPSLKYIPRMSLRYSRDLAETQEQITLIRELLGESLLFWNCYGARDDYSFYSLPKDFKFWYEWSQKDDLDSTRYLLKNTNCLGFILDLDWHQTHIKKVARLTALHFKLQGWDEVRWVRRYGPEKSKQLLQKLPSDSGLILSHSGRVAEALLFSSK